jgi:hypothetical protein
VIAPAPTEAEARRMHRPTDAATLAREAARLAAQGLTVRDIAHALGLGIEAALALLNASRRAP